ncbi:hypothetical protein H6F67_26320 [Microcoleus sp. FACHB-1515]|uniref:hypothetical protein n=1 Tax=Cyanophyceae TaxID=3028117 RepID=UPI001683AC19|nr:hypothetical protein [Microcoleus sp. FACHB-1515]MBD2093365.1 hypothetical protein [Microcoleus sp. FACHB-1515]
MILCNRAPITYPPRGHIVERCLHLAGAIADRFDRKRILVVTHLAWMGINCLVEAAETGNFEAELPIFARLWICWSRPDAAGSDNRKLAARSQNSIRSIDRALTAGCK